MINIEVRIKLQMFSALINQRHSEKYRSILKKGNKRANKNAVNIGLSKKPLNWIRRRKIKRFPPPVFSFIGASSYKGYETIEVMEWLVPF